MDSDLIIVGGGLAGSSLAACIARTGARVLVLERTEQFRDRVRGESMHPWGVPELRALGLYDKLTKTCAHQARYGGVAPVAIRDAGIDDDNAFRPDDETGIADAAAIGRVDFAVIADDLNDFDLAANNGGWQWAASTGCDAQPYFRIFNPVTQSEKFDPDGKFIRRYLPELRGLSSAAIHAPWLASSVDLASAGIVLGKQYPAPIVEHAASRVKALALYELAKQK